MSWHWSRLSTLAFLALLYASPLSSGDKGLWLSVTSMPVPLFGAIPGEMPAEHSILLPDRSELALVQRCVARGEPALGVGLVVVSTTTINASSTTASDRSGWGSLDPICADPTAPRGPPV